MTVIAVASNMMAADSMDTIGAVRVRSSEPKITRRGDGALIGIAGSCPAIEAFRQWWLGGADPLMRPVAAPNADERELGALELRPDGSLTCYDHHARPYRVQQPYTIGSDTAAVMVLAALLCGRSLEDSVGLACEHVTTVGGPVQIETPGRPSADVPITYGLRMQLTGNGVLGDGTASLRRSRKKKRG